MHRHEPADPFARVWQFREFSAEMLGALSASSHRETYAKGAAIVTEGDEGADAYVVVEGRLEVRVAGKNGALPVAALGEGELFGEIAGIAPTHRRTASVVALTPVTVMRIDAEALAGAVDAAPGVRAQIEAAAQRMAIGRFIKSATVLGDLPPDDLAALSEHVRMRSAGAGETIVRKGDPGEECFLVSSGELEVIDDSGAERRLAVLRPGMLFGEAALLTGAPRNATVRAISNVELFVLGRADMLAAMSAERHVADHLVALLQARSRPCRCGGIEVHERMTADGDAIITLKDTERGKYFRLSREGAFLWKRLDGTRTVRDLTMELFVERHILAPDVVLEILRHLAAEDFIELDRIDTGVAREVSGRARIAHAVRSAMEWSFAFEGSDRYFGALYRCFGRFVYGPLGVVLLALLAGGGFIAFLATAERSAGALLNPGTFARAGASLLPLIVVAIVLHEIGHGVAAKAAGARVDRVGFGWYWFRPIVFVDTSDAWLAPRAQRLLVDAGGILVNLGLAGAAGYVAFFARDHTVVAIAWVFALWSYVAVLRNLNPLLEYDGYYLLMDWLERPNLRTKSLAWLGTSLPSALRNRQRMRAHRFELWYGIGSVFYILLMTGWLMFAYRFTVQGWVARVVPPAFAPLLAEALALTISGLALLRLINDIRAERSRARGHVREALHAR